MGVRLNVPAPKETAQDQVVSAIYLMVPHAQTVPGEMNIVKADVHLANTIITYNTDGEQMDKQVMNIPWADVPAPGAVDMLKTLYAWIEAQAIAQGYIGDGVAEELGQAPVEP